MPLWDRYFLQTAQNHSVLRRKLLKLQCIERLPMGRGQGRNLSLNRTENGLLVIPNKEVVSIKYFQFEAAVRV